MKKLTSLLMALAMTLSLTACGPDDVSVGIIGGADGPTSILVTTPDWDKHPDFDPADPEEIGVIGSADTTTYIETFPGNVDGGHHHHPEHHCPDRGDYCYDLENVVLYLYYYDELPDNYITKSEARDLGWEGGTPERYLEGAAIGGDRFGNREGLLPDGNYTECDLNTLGADSRGAERLVFSDEGEYYYTDDHYESFTQVWVEAGEVIYE